MFSTIVSELWLPVTIALLGFTARALRFGVNSLKSGLSMAICSIISGIAVFWYLEDSNMTQGMKNVSILASGFGGGIVLDATLYRLLLLLTGGKTAESSLDELIEKTKTPINQSISPPLKESPPEVKQVEPVKPSIIPKAPTETIKKDESVVKVEVDDMDEIMTRT